MANEVTEVVSSTAVELVCRLYVAAHVSRGDFEQLPEHVEEIVSDEATHPLLLRYFGADFSPGMSLNALAIERGWQSAAELAAGFAALSAEEAVAALLASTTLEDADRSATRALVAGVLDGSAERAEAARKIARRNSYSRADVDFLFEDPSRAQHELTSLLQRGAHALSEKSVGAELTDRVAATTELIASDGREAALLESTGGWTLRDETQRLVLVPTQALGSLVITRLLSDDRIMVLFGPPRDRSAAMTPQDVAVVARALSSDQRIAILQLVGQEPASGQTLAKTLGLTQATMHYHTAMLRSSGLVTSTRDAHSVLHALNRAEVERALGGISRLLLGD